MAGMRSALSVSAEARRRRTRRLIELGGLVEASGLTERAGHDPAMILGALRVLVRMLDMAHSGDAGFSDAVLLKRWREAGATLVEDHNKAVEAIKREERGWNVDE
jgi:Conjugal transfer protein TraD